MLNIVRHTIELSVPADDIPEAIEVDLTGLDIGDSVHIAAVTLPEGVRGRPSASANFTIVTIAGARRRCATPGRRRRPRREEGGEAPAPEA